MAVVGCEPRVDYSDCPSSYKLAVPLFYLITLLVQLGIFVVASLSLLRTAQQSSRTAVAPHTRPRRWVRLARTVKVWSKDTVLQLKLGCCIFSFLAIVHRASLLQPTPFLPHLVVEYCYNLYNIFLIATIATTLRYWQEFMHNTADISGIKPPKPRLIDRLFDVIFSWRGCMTFSCTNAFVCLVTDTWGMAMEDVEMWQLAVKIQHFYLSGVCFLISMGSLRVGYTQERSISAVVAAHEAIIKGDAAFMRDLRKYRYLFRFAFVGNSLAWITCFFACGVGGVYFNTFYQLTHWALLLGYFNFVGLFFATVCFILCWPGMREAELRLHDLLAYCNLASQEQEAKMNASLSRTGSRNYSTPPGTPRHNSSVGLAFVDVCGDIASSSVTGNDSGSTLTSSKRLDMSKSYPCYVMSLEDLSNYDRLPVHEDALRDGKLWVVTKTSYWPCRSYVHFVSQTWIDRSHPDGEEHHGNPKLTWMKRVAPKVLANGGDKGNVFLWMDIFSIPQRTTSYTRMGIASLPNYAALVGGFIPLVASPSATDGYQRRGWCMIECICALTPKVNQKGEWRVGPHPRALRFHYYASEKPAVDLVTLQSLRNPGNPQETDFTVEDDRQVVHPIECVCAMIMALYARSESTSWDHTYEIDDRPGWLKLLGGDQDEI